MSDIISGDGDIVQARDLDANGPPQKNRRVRCLVCTAEFESEEIIWDSTYEVWACPYCLKAWGYRQEIVPIETKG